MTPEQRAAKVMADHAIAFATGSDGSGYGLLNAIAAAIRSAEAAAYETTAQIAETMFTEWTSLRADQGAEEIARAIRALISPTTTREGKDA